MLSSGGYYFSNSWSARPLTLWGFGSYQSQTKWSSEQALQRGCLYCRLIAHRSPHSCRTQTRPLFCFLRDNRSLSPLLQNKPGTIAPKWKPFVCAYYLISSCLEYNDDFIFFFSSLWQLPAFLTACARRWEDWIALCVLFAMIWKKRRKKKTFKRLFKKLLPALLVTLLHFPYGRKFSRESHHSQLQRTLTSSVQRQKLAKPGGNSGDRMRKKKHTASQKRQKDSAQSPVKTLLLRKDENS